MLTLDQIDLTLSGLKSHYARRDLEPVQLVELILQAIEKAAEEKPFNPIWIRVLTLEEIENYLSALTTKKPDQLPLYGVPFAIKDNIDLAGIPTTAACPEFSYTPEKSAFVVEQLIHTGAIPIGKANMDQFATGLVGTRSPWGACRNAGNPDFIAGGSSSGSALAVAKRLVSFSLGTDTAGSGRVPASLNNIVGLKPTRGLVSTGGVVPACRSLDCVSIFALNVEDANTVFDVAAHFDREDAYARRNCYANSKRYFGVSNIRARIGVPEKSQLEFFGDDEAERLFERAVCAVSEKNVDLVPINFSPFAEAAKLLYEGPWVVERYLATREIVDNNPETLLPVIRQIIAPARSLSATEVFNSQYRLRALQQKAQGELEKVDAVLVPTTGTAYTLDEVEGDPVRLNSNLGYYTNFMNLLDCAAVALPAGCYSSGVGFGITLFHRAYTDKILLSLGALLENGLVHSNEYAAATSTAKPPYKAISIVVCGAHLQGLPLNWQLTERGGVLLSRTKTAGCYRLFALAGGPPFRPGLLRDETGGNKIEVEVWSLPVENFGSFVAEIPPPLGIGKVQLEDGRWEPGFICEPYALDSAEDITDKGGWRSYCEGE